MSDSAPKTDFTERQHALYSLSKRHFKALGKQSPGKSKLYINTFSINKQMFDLMKFYHWRLLLGKMPKHLFISF